MAILGSTSLTGCDKIPKFIDSGSKMIFYMATVPVSWTKDTSPNETMCRITNSTLSPGGSLTFTQVFQSSKAITGTTAQQNLGFTVNPTSVPLGTGPASAGSVPVINPATVSVAQITYHYHPVSYPARVLSPFNPFGLFPGVNNQSSVTSLVVNSGTSGASQSHIHTTVPSIPHVHTFTPATHVHSITSSQSQHAHPITGSENFNILYVDVVVATKN